MAAYQNLPYGVKTALYGDELVTYSSCSTTITVVRNLHLAIKKLEICCDETGYKFSPTKTVGMHICRRRSCPKTVHQLTLHNEANTCEN